MTLTDILSVFGSPMRYGRARSDGWPRSWSGPSLLVGLVVLCAVPRIAMAWRLDVLCDDGPCYIRLAEAWQRGDWAQALVLQWNIYPMILAALNACGVSWEQAARCWGPFVATLTMLPLFGWLSRQFSRPVAAAGCLLYAVHPALIEWTPEMVRDSTFWLLTALTLYAGWRATSELSIPYFVAAGLALGFAVLTRFEGLLLLVPLGWWTARGGRGRIASRHRRGLGAALGLALPPLMILMLNVARPEPATQWQLFRLEPLMRLQRWVGSWGDPVLGPVGLASESASADLGSSLWRRFNPGFQFFWSMQRGVTPVHGGLLVWGLGAWWRKWRRAAGGPLVLTAILTTVGIWIHLRATGSASSRYWLTAVLLSLPMAGLGLESLVSAVARWLAKRTGPHLAVRTALVSCVGLLVITGWIDALSANLDSRRHYAELGRWIQGHFGPQQIFGTDDHLPLVSHYARAHYTPIPRTATGQSLVRLIEGCGPEVVILTRRGAWEDYRQLLDERSRLGLERIDASQLPPGAERFVVLARAVHRH